MKNVWKVLAAVLAGVVLSGCAAFSNINAPEKASAVPPGGAGTIIFSTGAKARCFAAVTELFISPVGARYFWGASRAAMVDNYSVKSDFTDHHGNVHVIVLPAGQYQVYPVVLNPYLIPNQVPKAEFTVNAGETVYIGEIYMPVACALNDVLEFRDNFERDMAFVRIRNPAFADVTVEKRVSRFTGYLMGGQ